MFHYSYCMNIQLALFLPETINIKNIVSFLCVSY